MELAFGILAVYYRQCSLKLIQPGRPKFNRESRSMTISMYKLSVPIFVQFLTAQSDCMDKAVAHIEAKQLDPNFLFNMRLFPDMFPYSRQVQQAGTHAIRCCSALSGTEMPYKPYTETGFSELKKRIADTIDYCKTFRAAQIDGTEDKDVTIKLGADERKFTGLELLQGFVLPNFYFHCTTAYDILRHCGIQLGKRDFMSTPVKL
jgi:hypothetical protein